MTEQLRHAFDAMSPDEKIAFVRAIIPQVCAIFREDPQRMMTEMMPMCRQMMQDCGMDMQKMMGLMQTLQQSQQ